MILGRGAARHIASTPAEGGGKVVLALLARREFAMMGLVGRVLNWVLTVSLALGAALILLVWIGFVAGVK